MKRLAPVISLATALLFTLGADIAIAEPALRSADEPTLHLAEPSLSVPPNAMAGTSVRVRCPEPSGGRIELLDADGRTVTRHDLDGACCIGSEIVLAAPDVPGDYEVRYLISTHGQEPTTRLKPVSASLFVYPAGYAISAPQVARPGQDIDVRWLGPAQDGDFISLTLIGAQVNEWYDRALVTRGREPVRLRIPDRPGRYELRYVLARAGTILSARELNATTEPARLRVVDKAVADELVQVHWNGPARPGDYIAIRETTDDLHIWRTRTRVAGSNGRVLLRAPPEPGHYALHYQDGDTGAVSAVAVLRVRSGRP